MPVRARSRSSMSAMVLPAGSADPPQLVELGIEAVPDEPAVARERWRLVDQRARSIALADVGQVVELRQQAADERRLELGELLPHARHAASD